MTELMEGQWLIIVGDQKDGNYVTNMHLIRDDELESIMPVITAVKGFTPYEVDDDGYNRTHQNNWPYGENSPRYDLGEKYPAQIYSHVDEHLIDWFQEYVPSNIQRIKSIEVVNISSVRSLL